MLVTFVLFLFGMMTLSRMMSYLDDYFSERIDGIFLSCALAVQSVIFAIIIVAMVWDL